MRGEPSPCPSCPENMRIEPGYIDEVITAKRSLGVDLVEDHIYIKRLEICGECETCMGGIICRMCGCFIQVRALSTLRKCPHPKGDRWILEGGLL